MLVPYIHIPRHKSSLSRSLSSPKAASPSSRSSRISVTKYQVVFRITDLPDLPSCRAEQISARLLLLGHGAGLVVLRFDKRFYDFIRCRPSALVASSVARGK
jgi:hypothetical protein